MRSEKVVAYGEPLKEIVEPDPTPQGREVLVRLTYCGVCHSDVHLHDGYFHMGGETRTNVGDWQQLPHTLGHEMVGVVEKVGPEAQGVAPGDRRIVFPWIGCGQCDLCLGGLENLCVGENKVLGVRRAGGFSDHVLVPDAKYLVPFDGIPEERAGPFACSGLTAYGALKKLGNLGRDPRVLVVGAGGVGMMGLQFAKALFGTAPMVADIDPAKRDAAKRMGAASTWDSGDPATPEAFLAATGTGAHGVVDFVGSEASIAFALACVRPGGRVVIVGLYGGTLTLPILTFPFRAIGVIGSMVGTLDELKECVALAQAGKVDPVPVEVRPLAEASRTLDDLRGGKVVGRVVLQA
jgi:D-arabinose 1-dehydrogenase-like Zn-dependent alcohol dehydrogenase